jgi:hypothetical protein
MISFGNVPANSVLPIPFDSFAGATGASITITGLAVTDIEVYKGTSMTQRASDAGYVLMDTDGIDLDGITGIQGFSIDLGDNTDAGFYAVGSFYYVVVSAITVDTQTVNFVAATFRIVTAEAVAGKPKVDVDAWLGTAAATPTVAGVPEVDVTHVGGTAQTAGDIMADTNDIQARLPAALTADGNIKADTLRVGGTLQTAGDIMADTNDIQTRLPAALVGGRMDSSVGAIAAGVGSGIRKNVALAKFEFLMTDSTNHAPATGKTVTVTRSIDNGAFAAGTLSAVTEIAFGIYSVDFASGDLNGTVITLRATATGCDDLLVTIVPDP